MSMENWRDLKAHPAADVLPMMTSLEREKLKVSILDKGYHPNEPIVLLDGQIVDGRNRHSICSELDVEPTFTEYAGDPEDIGSFVLDKNVGTWRELNQFQKGLVHLAMSPFVKQRAQALVSDPGGRPKTVPHDEARFLEPHEKRRWTQEVGQQIGVSRGTMDRCAFVHFKDPELAERCIKGEVKMKDALSDLGWVDSVNGMPKERPKTEPVRRKRPRQETLEGWEAMIEGRIEAYLDVAYALLEIRDKRLYLEQHGEFRHYLRDRWGVSFRRFSEVLIGLDAVLMATDKEDRNG